MKYLPLFHDLSGRKVVVAGGGGTAARKLALLLRAGARPLVFAHAAGSEVQALADAGEISLVARSIATRDLDDAALLVVAGAAMEEARRLAAAARAARIPVNVVDGPALSTVVMPGIVDRDPVLVAIGSSGTAPVLVRRVREAIEAALPARLGCLSRFAGRFRSAVARAVPGSAARRRFWEVVLDGPVAQAVLAGREGAATEAMLRLVNSPIAAATVGRVALIGVGPGDPDLLTLRALRLMQDADLILHDADTPSDILDRVRRDARRLALRHGDAACAPLMAGEARRGQCVVRLVGGDGQDAHDLARDLAARGIAVETVPGIAIPQSSPMPARIAG